MPSSRTVGRIWASMPRDIKERMEAGRVSTPPKDSPGPNGGHELDAQLHGGTVEVAQRPADQHLVVAGAVEVAGVDQGHAASTAARIVARLSSSSRAPYAPDMPIAPSPKIETVGPGAPRRRVGRLDGEVVAGE